MKAKIILFKQHDTLVQALLRKKIDFALMPHHIAEHWYQHSSGLIQFVGEPLYLGLGVAIAVNREDVKLLSDINIALLHYQASNEFKKDFETYLLTY
ncbi:type 2 periplasmic-binding domain-containing protein [Legionella tunisiensis]|uniref:transporter substrate-binding domain-containing protein n=1 Tax=Legionella tunisiensis TaxID=1034944 RepID=UPI0002E10A44|nr:transporter substrate-binding domain-containing protein [Legionella tunisiensis]